MSKKKNFLFRSNKKSKCVYSLVHQHAKESVKRCIKTRKIYYGFSTEFEFEKL